jgi:hypothetical protein
MGRPRLLRCRPIIRALNRLLGSGIFDLMETETCEPRRRPWQRTTRARRAVNPNQNLGTAHTGRGT